MIPILDVGLVKAIRICHRSFLEKSSLKQDSPISKFTETHIKDGKCITTIKEMSNYGYKVCDTTVAGCDCMRGTR